MEKMLKELKSNLTELKNIVQLLELLFTPKWTLWLILDKRKTTFLKFKSTVERLLLIKLTLFTDSLKNKLELIKYSETMNLLMLLVLLKVKDSQVLLKDGVLDIYKRNPIEVIEKSVVSVLGIQQESLGQLLELVNQGISTELKSTRKFTELVKEKEEELKIMLPLQLIQLKRILHQWVVSHTMVSLRMILLFSKDVVLVQRRDFYY